MNKHRILLLAFGALFAACVGDTAATEDGGADVTVDQQADASPSDAAVDACAACDGATCFEGVCNGNQVVQISAGYQMGCAVTKAGSVWCWGRNDKNQVAIPSGSSSTCTLRGGTSTSPCEPTPKEVQGVFDVAQVSAGVNTVCVVKRDHTVWCWGGDNHDQLGHDNSLDTQSCVGTPCSSAPVQVSGLAASQVSVGSAAACAVTTTGAVACWGYNNYGQLGTGSVGGQSAAPVTIASLSSGVTQVSHSPEAAHVCARKNDSSVWCWGGAVQNGGEGHQPGTHGDIVCNVTDAGSSECAPTPQPAYQGDNATPIANVAAVAVGDDNACALGSNVQCWGLNPFDQVANTNPGPIYSPSTWSTLTGNVQLPASFDSHVCALVGATAWCWGVNLYGQLGLGTYDPVVDDAGSPCPSGPFSCLPPTPIPTHQFTQISVSQDFSMALKADGTVWTWGVNDTGRLGHAPNTSGDVSCNIPTLSGPCNLTPTRVMGLP